MLKIDLASGDTVDRLCSRLRTTVDSKGSGEPTPEGRATGELFWKCHLLTCRLVVVELVLQVEGT